MNIDSNLSPRILILSNNPLSDRSNNGKTLAAIMKGYDVSRIRQLYFSAEEPMIPIDSYYKIADLDILKNIIGTRSEEGVVFVNEDPTRIPSIYAQTSKFGQSASLRLLRELIWIGHWHSHALDRWLESSPPQVLFFVAGDSIFAHRIYTYITDKFHCKTIIYITDDYCLPQMRISPFFWIRRSVIKAALVKSVRNCSVLLTISSVMRKTYKDLLRKDSYIIRNIAPEAPRNESYSPPRQNNVVQLVYAGGLHFNRWRILAKLAEAISVYNTESLPKVILKVYCAQRVKNHVIKRLCVFGASEYCGAKSSRELSTIYSEADVLVHVEAFDSKSRAATRLSLSTKIPEYLAMSKCILAIGPPEVASMQYLFGYCVAINRLGSIDKQLIKCLVDPELRRVFSRKATLRLGTLEEGELQRQDLQELIRGIT